MKKRKQQEDMLIEGMTVAQWDQKWESVAGGFREPHPELRYEVGLLRAVINGETVYIGRATERPGGLAKRLADFRRFSSSARDHHAGRLIHDHLGDAKLYVLRTGSYPGPRRLATLLKGAMIDLHKPRDNVPNVAL